MSERLLDESSPELVKSIEGVKAIEVVRCELNC